MKFVIGLDHLRSHRKTIILLVESRLGLNLQPEVFELLLIRALLKQFGFLRLVGHMNHHEILADKALRVLLKRLHGLSIECGKHLQNVAGGDVLAGDHGDHFLGIYRRGLSPQRDADG